MIRVAELTGLSALCVLALCTMLAQGACAAGTTAYTCKEGAETSNFSDAHCKASGTGPFGHTKIANGTVTEAQLTNETTGGATSVFHLKATYTGVAVDIHAKTVLGTGTLQNREVGGEMDAEGTGSITFSNVAVTKPAGKGCKVFEDPGGEVMGTEGVVRTEMLTAMTNGQGMGLRITPDAAAGASAIAHFWIAGCEGPIGEILNGTHTLEGSVTGTPSGATVEFTHTAITVQGTLLLDGISGGLEGSLTIKARANTTQVFAAIAATT